MAEVAEVTYSDKLKDNRWLRRRVEILQRDDFKCRYCGNNKNPVHVHHLKYVGEPWDAPNECLITLCDKHHDKLHKFEKIQVISNGYLNPYDFLQIDLAFISLALCYLENREGLWIIEFRNDVSEYEIVRLICMLYRFITPTDCDIRIKTNGNELDIYRYLNELTIPIE